MATTATDVFCVRADRRPGLEYNAHRAQTTGYASACGVPAAGAAGADRIKRPRQTAMLPVAYPRRTEFKAVYCEPLANYLHYDTW